MTVASAPVDGLPPEPAFKLKDQVPLLGGTSRWPWIKWAVPFKHNARTKLNFALSQVIKFISQDKAHMDYTFPPPP